METKEQIRAIVHGILANTGDEQPLADNDSLFLSGRLQSIDAVEIVLFLEEKFGINFAEIGFDQEQIDSIAAVCSLVATAATRK